MIAIILPTRGLVFTEVLQAIERERAKTEGYVKVFTSSHLKIPESFNSLAEEALSDPRIKDLWFIEEDTVPPVGAIKDLYLQNADIAFIDYAVQGWTCSAKDKGTNEVLWCGMGCTMIKRKVFEALDKPYFRDDKALRLNDWEWIDTNPDKVYGGQDIWFCTNARAKGFKIEQVEGECKHLKLDQLGKPGVNKGLHIISEKLKIEKYQIIER